MIYENIPKKYLDNEYTSGLMKRTVDMVYVHTCLKGFRDQLVQCLEEENTDSGCAVTFGRYINQCTNILSSLENNLCVLLDKLLERVDDCEDAINDKLLKKMHEEDNFIEKIMTDIGLNAALLDVIYITIQTMTLETFKYVNANGKGFACCAKIIEKGSLMTTLY